VVCTLCGEKNLIITPDVGKKLIKPRKNERGSFQPNKLSPHASSKKGLLTVGGGRVRKR